MNSERDKVNSEWQFQRLESMANWVCCSALWWDIMALVSDREKLPTLGSEGGERKRRESRTHNFFNELETSPDTMPCFLKILPLPRSSMLLGWSSTNQTNVYVLGIIPYNYSPYVFWKACTESSYGAPASSPTNPTLRGIPALLFIPCYPLLYLFKYPTFALQKSLFCLNREKEISFSWANN